MFIYFSSKPLLLVCYQFVEKATGTRLPNFFALPCLSLVIVKLKKVVYTHNRHETTACVLQIDKFRDSVVLRLDSV